MTFKEKHLVPLLLAATLTTSCSEDKRIFFKEKTPESQGLLDERSLKENDKYNTAITLYQVDVPLYKRNGERLKEQYMLTRGLQKSKYKSSQSLEEMSVKAVYINGSNEVSYVKVDNNNAIYTERGFCGLFIDYNKKAVVIADSNVSRFVAEMNVKSMTPHSRAETRRNDNRMSADIADVEKSDSIGSSDVKVEQKDSLLGDTVNIDSSVQKKVFRDKQFLDTLKSMRQNTDI